MYVGIVKPESTHLKHELQPIMVVSNLYNETIVSLYIENCNCEIAVEIIASTNVKLTYSMYYDLYDDPDSYRGGGSCVFCGSPTYDNILCPTCANNVD